MSLPAASLSPARSCSRSCVTSPGSVGNFPASSARNYTKGGGRTLHRGGREVRRGREIPPRCRDAEERLKKRSLRGLGLRASSRDRSAEGAEDAEERGDAEEEPEWFEVDEVRGFGLGLLAQRRGRSSSARRGDGARRGVAQNN